MASKGKYDDDVSLITRAPSDLYVTYNGEKKRSNFVHAAIRFFSVVVLLLIFAFIIYFGFLLGERRRDCVGVMQHDYVTGCVYLSHPKTGKEFYFGQLGKHLGERHMKRRPIENGFEYRWENGVVLVIKKDNNDSCTSVSWRGIGATPPNDCFSLNNSHWYGAGELYNQVWPLEKAVLNSVPFYPQDIIEEHYNNNPAIGPVLGRYFITSNGTAILVDQRSPLVVSINGEKLMNLLCLTVDVDKYPINTTLELNYTLCQQENVKSVHQYMLARFFKKPAKGPDTRMMQQPVWSTWVKYHKGVNQSDVEQFIDEIIENKFSCSQIEIDDMYSTTYGDYNFDPVKFPNATDMIEKIHKSGCRVTAWVHPFANANSKAYDEGKAKRYFVVGPDGETVEFLFWWNGIGAAVDFTNPAAYNWYLGRLKNFSKAYGIDSFKFDAGSVSYLPYRYQLNDSSLIPSNYSVAYATLASEINNMVEVRVGDNSQDLPVFVRFLDRDATWSGTMGLQSVVPTVLTFGILGYPFILPDMIGGNGDPDKELFVRWLQLNAFLPAMQFSHAPWDFDTDAINIAHNMMKIREAIFPTLLEGVSNAVKTGEPIIRPLWWIAPNDTKALTNNQQFMVMDEYLVAPVTEPGASNMTVYLPEGKWMEQFGKMVVHTMNEGGSVFYNNVTLYDVFYFKNVSAEYLLNTVATGWGIKDNE